MNLLSVISFVLAALVFTFGALTATDNPWTFVDAHAILIVIGGSLAASSIAFQLDRMVLLFKVFIRRVIQGRREHYSKIIEELMRIAEAYRTNSPNLKQLIDSSGEPFIREAMNAIQDGVLEREVLVKVLRTRVSTIFHRQTEDSIKFKTVGKYPPAFGLMGTTLGMIALLQKIGQPGSQKLIGPSMSIALVATLYGISLANLVFGPIAENLMDSAKENRLKHTIIVEGVILIMDRTNPIVLAEELNSYLLPSERIDWKKVTSGGHFKKTA